MRLQRQSDGASIVLDPAQTLGRGGEALVFAAPFDAALVAKIYHDPTEERARKLDVMVANPPDDLNAIAWPLDLLRTGGAKPRTVGYLMPRASGVRPIFTFYNPATRREQCPLSNYLYLTRTARNLAAAVRALHARGYVIGDVNESNILVTETALVTLVDTDSFQVRDPQTGAVYRCPVGKPEFTPPELQGKTFAHADRQPAHDRFGLAVLLFQLLMEGVHPFAGIYQGEGDPPPHEERIAAGHFPYGNRRVPYRPMPFAPPFEMLHPDLRRLFTRAFETGHDNPALRPTADEWFGALTTAEADLIVCPVNPQHRYGSHLPACPWCARTARLGGRDPFPSRQAVQRGEYLPPRRRRAPSPRSQTPLAQSGRPNASISAAMGAVVVPTGGGIALPALAPLSYAPRAGAAPAPPGTPGVNYALAPTGAYSPSLYGPSAPVVAVPAPPQNVWAWLAMGAALVAILPMLSPLFGTGALLCGVMGLRESRKMAGIGRAMAAWSLTLGGLLALMNLISLGVKTYRPAAVQTLAGHFGGVNAVAFSPDGRLLASASDRPEDRSIAGGEANLWDARSGDEIQQLPGGYSGAVTSVAFSPNGRWLAVSSGGPLTPHEVRLWNVPGGRWGPTLAGHRSFVQALAFSPDSRLLASGSRDRSVNVWDAATGELTQRLDEWQAGEVFSVAYSPDGKWLAAGLAAPERSGGTGRVEVWNAQTGRRLWSRGAHSLGALCVRFAPDGTTLASSGQDNAIRFWNPTTGQVVRTLEMHGVQEIPALAFSADGQRLVTGGSDANVTLWNVATGRITRVLTGHHAVVLSVAFAPDGRRVASGSRDETAKIWRLR